MITLTKQIPNNVVDYLERLSFEVEGMKRVIKELIMENASNPSFLESETFQKYNERYELRNAAYEIGKNEMAQNFLPQDKTVLSWNLNFSTGILTYVIEQE